jgi:hypothetical protein
MSVIPTNTTATLNSNNNNNNKHMQPTMTHHLILSVTSKNIAM